MEYNEAVRLAENGDVNMMMELAKFHSNFDKAGDEARDLNKAIDWYEKAVQCGNLTAMLLGASLCNLNAHIMMSISPELWNDAVTCLNKAINWTQEAFKAGEQNSSQSTFYGSKELLGRAYMYAGLYDDNDDQKVIDYFKLSIANSKSAYGKPGCRSVAFYLGYTLFLLNNKYGELNIPASENDLKIMVSSLEEYALSGVDKKELGLANMTLGLIYSYGYGCIADHTKAYNYYFAATNQYDMDCSEDLKKFRRNSYGGYDFIG